MTDDHTRRRDGARITLQTLTVADPEICTETSLYARLQGPVFPSLSSGRMDMAPGGEIDLLTYFNALNLGNWMRHCALDGLEAVLFGEGRVWLQAVLHAPQGYDDRTLHQEIVTLAPDGLRIDLSAATQMVEAAGGSGVLGLRLRAVGDAHLDAGRFETRAPTARTGAPRLAIAITTFRREADVTRTMRRISAFLDDPSRSGTMGERSRIFVVDNGRSVPDPGLPRAEVIPNPNLGGAGGFARGLAAAVDGGFSHCLFMDDDASFQMESLVRTDAFLTLARDPAAALSGAMISSARKWAMWENGSVFHRCCRPEHVGTDLRHPQEVLEMEYAAAREKAPGFYAGWWYFAFPVAAVRRWPFPFFVRGDDISFSLANRFRTATMNGVVSFQEDFSSKESPSTLYLDMRNHLHHHLAHEGMEIGWRGTAKIPLRFMARSLVRFHYESAEAQLMAWEDVMRGPDFFAAHADMSERRADLGALTVRERFAPLAPGEAPPEWSPPGAKGWRLRALVATLNGHLLPFFCTFARPASVPIQDRGLVHPVWGHDELTYLAASREAGYTVRMDRRRFFGLLRRAASLTLRWRREYTALRAVHREAYPKMADRAFWQPRFDAAKPAAPESQAAAAPRAAAATGR